MKKTICFICSSKEFYYIKRENKLRLVRCRNCGLVQVKDVPQERELKKFYTKFHKEKDEKLWQRFNRGIFELAKRRIIREKGKGDLLDIGCGYGFFLRLMKEAGFNVTGIEIARGPASYVARNLNIKVINADFNKVNFKKKFDVITLWWVLEHLPYPEKTLSKVKKTLKKNGILILRVPNVNFILFVYRFRFLGPYLNFMINPVAGKKDFFEILGAPYHLFGYNPKNLTKLLRNLGFSKVKVFLDGEIKTGIFTRDLLERLLYYFSRILMIVTSNRLIFYHDFMIKASVNKEVE